VRPAAVRPLPAGREAVLRRIAEYLAGHGPTQGADAAEAIGLTLEEWWRAVSTAPGRFWFSIEGPAIGWRLTTDGQAWNESNQQV
jgi:hypothetical protein